MSEKKYITIFFPRKVKDLLEKEKGDMDWGEYLTLLYRKYDRNRRHQNSSHLSDSPKTTI